MKASELRICNLIFTHKEEIIVVKGIDIEGLILFKEDQNIFDFKCKPIPLTEEWLLKFGFYAKHHHDNFSFNGFEISSSQRRIDTNERSVFYLMLTEDSKFNIRIEHVHQLQNLYFSLTGQELIIVK